MNSRKISPLCVPVVAVVLLSAAPLVLAHGTRIKREVLDAIRLAGVVQAGETQPKPNPTRQAPSKGAPAATVKSTKPNPKPAPAPRVQVTPQPLERKYYPSPTAAVLDPNITPYPRSSLHNFSDLLDAPAGKHGFLKSKGEHFVWQDGTRARFWGINVANTSLQEPEADIAAMIQNFRSAGFNLVRLHHFDERGGIIDLDAPDSRRLVAERLKKLDYWIYKAKQAGLYVYLDLLDYRRFKEGDGVQNAEAIGRAARPYAVFDPRLIELQKEYARQLLTDHVNSYTGLSYADDPAIVMLEVYDESGLFMKRGVWRQMPEPYAANFKKLWNDWLRERYKNTDGLLRAWSDLSGNSALIEGENLEKGNVEVPALTWTPNQLPESQREYALLARRNDGALFAYVLHRKFFREMKKYLQDIGVKIPISVTGRFDDLADLKSISSELDFVGTNFYYDHPYWGGGKPAWQPPSYFRNANPLSDVDDLSFAASISLARIKNKPLVVREWNYCWPNRNRAAGILEAACYAALHDIDAMILFGYETRPTARVSYFNVRSDPSRWGLCGIGAAIFLGDLIKPSQHRIVVPYNVVDTFTYTRYSQPLYALGWATRVENDFYDGNIYKSTGDSDLLLMPGRSGVGKLTGAPAVLWTNDRRTDLAGRSVFTPEYLADYGLTAQRGGDISLTYNGLLFPDGRRLQRTLSFGVPLGPIVSSGSRAIGFNHQWGVASGFLDEKNQRLVFGSLDPNDVFRAALDAMKLFYNVPNSHDANDQNVFTTDTGEMYRDSASGRLIVSAPQIQALCGNLNGVGRVLAPGLKVRNLKNGTLVALALDGKPLVESRRFVVKMVTDARNADEVSGRDPRFVSKPDGQWQATVLGEGPVTTNGAESKIPIQISIENRPLLDVFLSGGGFELLVDGDDWQFYSDTPGVRFVLHQKASVLAANQSTPAALASRGGSRTEAVKTQNVMLRQVLPDGSFEPLPATRQKNQIAALYPANAAYVEFAANGKH
jgi:hypothetical protein